MSPTHIGDHTRQASSSSPAVNARGFCATGRCPRSLSDRAFVSVNSTVTRWILDVDAFARGRTSSGFKRSMLNGLTAAFYCCNTSRDLADKHATLESERVRHRSSARWFDSSCCASRRRRRQLQGAASTHSVIKRHRRGDAPPKSSFNTSFVNQNWLITGLKKNQMVASMRLDNDENG